ncbi:MAG: SlyX family protein [Methylococcales bacterium]|jgi:SlyX protein|nr:SlyX family protein [Methylococcales bacterium]MBT7411203.1 SlyX family protein [Methylococcales bacterium]
MTTEERLINIETKLAFQEQTVNEMSDIIYQQQKKIDFLIRNNEFLVSHVQKLVDQSKSAEGIDERPPHY